jgi:hypothetical protein
VAYIGNGRASEMAYRQCPLSRLFVQHTKKARYHRPRRDS